MAAFKHLLTLLFALSFGQGFSQQKFDITISLDSSINSKNISCHYADGIDIAFVTDTFADNTLNLNRDFYAKFASIRIDYNSNGRSLSNTFFIDNKPAKIHFTGKININENQLDYDSIKNAIPVFDTATNKIWKELSIYIHKQTQAISDLWEKHGTEIGKNDSIALLNKKLFRALNDRSIEFLKNYPNDYFSFWFFREEIVMPSIVFMSKDTGYMRSLLVSFNSIFPVVYTKSFEGQKVIEQLSGLIKAQEANQQALPFSLKDPEGKMVSSSDFKGKYILLDFWASWCAPCRRNNPILKSTYDKYQNSKFELISISADEDSTLWKAAIQKDSMNWVNLLDLKELKSQVVIKYGIIGFPTYILVDPYGNIILRNVNEIAKVQEKLKEIFTSEK